MCGAGYFKGIVCATLAARLGPTDRDTRSSTRQLHTQTHRRVCGVCTCERILSAGPNFSPMVLSRCSSVSSGSVSPSMACSRNTWQRHSLFSHGPDTHAHTHTYTLKQPTNSGSVPKSNKPSFLRGKAPDCFQQFYKKRQ